MDYVILNRRRIQLLSLLIHELKFLYPEDNIISIFIFLKFKLD